MILEEDSFRHGEASGGLWSSSAAGLPRHSLCSQVIPRHDMSKNRTARHRHARARRKGMGEQQFIDIAYSTPVYLKDFQATQTQAQGIMTETGSDFAPTCVPPPKCSAKVE